MDTRNSRRPVSNCWVIKILNRASSLQRIRLRVKPAVHPFIHPSALRRVVFPPNQCLSVPMSTSMYMPLSPTSSISIRSSASLPPRSNTRIRRVSFSSATRYPPHQCVSKHRKSVLLSEISIRSSSSLPPRSNTRIRRVSFSSATRHPPHQCVSKHRKSVLLSAISIRSSASLPPRSNTRILHEPPFRRCHPALSRSSSHAVPALRTSNLKSLQLLLWSR